MFNKGTPLFSQQAADVLHIDLLRFLTGGRTRGLTADTRGPTAGTRGIVLKVNFFLKYVKQPNL